MSGVTLIVSAGRDGGECRSMEDYLAIHLPSSETAPKIPASDQKEQAFLGVFDGHGGIEAALYASEWLWCLLVEQRKFHTSDRQLAMGAFRDAYLAFNREMELLRCTLHVSCHIKV